MEYRHLEIPINSEEGIKTLINYLEDDWSIVTSNGTANAVVYVIRKYNATR